MRSTQEDWDMESMDTIHERLKAVDQWVAPVKHHSRTFVRYLPKKEHVMFKQVRYCWSTPKYRNCCAQHAFFEGKKAEETAPRKSTPRTLKEVGQQ